MDLHALSETNPLTQSPPILRNRIPPAIIAEGKKGSSNLTDPNLSPIFLHTHSAIESKGLYIFISL
jgi:hypothetical protein